MVLDAHSMKERPLVRSSETVLPSMLPQAPDKAGWPVLAGWAVLVVCLVEWALGKRWLRRVLPLITGCVGLLLSFLWFGTDHADTRFNLNILWAFPLHVLGVQASSLARPSGAASSPASWAWPPPAPHCSGSPRRK